MQVALLEKYLQICHPSSFLWDISVIFPINNVKTRRNIIYQSTFSYFMTDLT